MAHENGIEAIWPGIDGYSPRRCLAARPGVDVWHAHQQALGRDVLIKIPTAALYDGPGVAALLHDCASQAARLDHPGIVPLYTVGDLAGRPFYVFEFVPGVGLGELLRKGPLPEAQALQVAEGVAHALDFARRSERLYHGDLHPHNIILDREGLVRVTDFCLGHGIRKAAAQAGLQAFGVWPNFAAPEQADPAGRLDARTDIYSLGAILYRALTGVVPFAEYDPGTILHHQQTGYLVGPLALRAGLSDGIAWLLEKAMVKNVGQRFESWSEFLIALAEVQLGQVPSFSLPAAGSSTIRRAPRPTPTPTPAPAPAPSPPAPPGPPGAKKTSRVSQIHAPRPVVRAVPHDAVITSLRPRHTAGQRIGRLCFVVGSAVLVYLFYNWYINQGEQMPALTPEQQRVRALAAFGEDVQPGALPSGLESELPPGTVGSLGRRRLAPLPREVEEEAARLMGRRYAPQAVEGLNEPQLVWDNADFLQGARAYNRAVEIYLAFQTDRSDRSQLRTAEQLTRTAIEAFELCKELAPATVPVGDMLRQAYHLMSDIRQSTVVLRAQEPAPPMDSPAVERPAPLLNEAPAPKVFDPGEWNHPPFIRAVRRYNEAQAILDRYRQGGAGARDLQQGMLAARESFRILEGLRGQAPAEVNLRELTDHVNELAQLIQRDLLVAPTEGHANRRAGEERP